MKNQKKVVVIMKKENKNTEQFLSMYNQLNFMHKETVFQTLRQMSLPSKAVHIDTMFEIIDEEIKKNNLTRAEILKQLASINNQQVENIEKTYDSFIYRKSYTSNLLPCMKKILGIKDNDERFLEKTFPKVINISWLFNSLNTENKNAILTLVHCLYRIEFLPESYD